MSLLNGPRATARAGLAHLLGRAPLPTATAAPAAETTEDAEEAAEEEDAEGEPKPEATEDADPTTTAEAEEEDEATMKSAALAERTRIGAILNHPNAAANMPAAMELALNSDMPAAQATALLGKLGASKPGLASRMATQPNPALGDAPGQSGSDGAEVTDLQAAKALARQMHDAANKLRGTSR
jgi:hypothetical protein